MITKSDRRFTGTWSWQDSSSYQSYAWGGTLRDDNIPVVPKPVDPVPTEPEPEEPETTDEGENTTASWKVTLQAICLTRRGTDEDNTPGLLAPISVVHSLAWVKTRIIHKSTGEEISIAPDGGFPNLNGDKERADDGGRSMGGSGRCSRYSEDGANNEDGLSFVYNIDAEKYGYSSIAELLEEPRNRIRVMAKLTEKDTFTSDDELGTQAVSTPLSAANFCGSCKATHEKTVVRKESGEIEKIVWNWSLYNAPIGDGVFSNYRDGDTKAVFLYDIKRMAD